LPEKEKRAIDMSKGGKAWRGFFSVGEELTSGKKDQKEGLYLGMHEPNSPSLPPLRGENLYPLQQPLHDDMKEAIEEYMVHMRSLGEVIIKAIGKSLELPEQVLDERFEQPTELFRIFHYPALLDEEQEEQEQFGVGKHSDYGWITILLQDDVGGLQVELPSVTQTPTTTTTCTTNEEAGSNNSSSSSSVWLDAPPIPGTFVVNLGDALEAFTSGYYVATPHRVKTKTKAKAECEGGGACGSQGRVNRLSFPYFFDPSFSAPLASALPLMSADMQKRIEEERRQQQQQHSSRASKRWDKQDPSLFTGTYGDYLQSKIAKVFPHLFANTLETNEE